MHTGSMGHDDPHHFYPTKNTCCDQVRRVHGDKGPSVSEIGMHLLCPYKKKSLILLCEQETEEGNPSWKYLTLNLFRKFIII